MEWIKHIILLVIVFLIQVLLIGNLHLWGICHPYIYILCLLMLPITLPVWAEMLIGVAVGGLMDIFSNTPGVHFASCVLLMYMRRLIIPRLVFEPERLSGPITSESIGPHAFFQYVILLTLLHHTAVLQLSAWSFSHIGWTLLAILVSSLVSIGVILLYDLIQTRR